MDMNSRCTISLLNGRAASGITGETLPNDCQVLLMGYLWAIRCSITLIKRSLAPGIERSRLRHSPWKSDHDCELLRFCAETGLTSWHGAIRVA